MDRIELLRYLRESFSDNELRDLCFVMKVNYDALNGENLAAKARELVAWCDRRDRLAELESTAQQLLNEYATGQRPHPTSAAANTTMNDGVNVSGDHQHIGGSVVGRDQITSNTTIDGDQIQGDKVQGDKVQGDKVQGDKILGDKVVQYITPTLSLRATPPRPPDHFTGREADLDKFTRLLTEGKNVAITALHGLGGIGKTSLAQMVAQRIAAQFPGGVLWWTLGPNPDVITALDVWARHADAHADLSSLPTAEARAEAVRPLLAQLGKLCVIIDDVWDAASFNVLRSAIPAGNPVLMTTRDADLAKTLRCRVERIDALSDDEAVDLLEKLLGPLGDDSHPERSVGRPSTTLRSAQDAPDAQSKDALSAAIDIAHLTEGLPLALELIAGLADSPADLPALAQKLRTRPTLDVLARGSTREQSIEACFALSYAALSDDLKQRFAALGVFALSPFGREAIAAVWDDDDAGRVDDAIRLLVRRSLLSSVMLSREAAKNPSAADETVVEYRQHALLHAYALKLLAEEGPLFNPPPSETASDRGGSGTPSPVRGSTTSDNNAADEERTGEGWEGGSLFHARHADYYRAFARTQPWRAVEHAFDQVEHGWQWVQQNAPEQIIDYVFAAQDFLTNRGRHSERLTWLNAGLTRAREIQDYKQEGTLLNNIGFLHNAIGLQDKALEYYEQALTIHREVGNRAVEGTTLNNLGLVYDDLGQKDKALEYYAQALVIRREVGDRAGEGVTLNNLGEVYRALGQQDKALDYYEQALDILRDAEHGDRAREGATLNNLGEVYRALGQKEKALDYYEQALTIHREVGNRAGEGTTLNNLGLVHDNLGQQDKALSTFGQALVIRREVGDRAGEGTTLGNLGAVYRALGQMDKALDYMQQSITILREVGNRWSESVWLYHIGTLLYEMGRTAEAVSYLEQNVALDEAIGHPDLESDRAALARVRAKLQGNE